MRAGMASRPGCSTRSKRICRSAMSCSWLKREMPPRNRCIDGRDIYKSGLAAITTGAGSTGFGCKNIGRTRRRKYESDGDQGSGARDDGARSAGAEDQDGEAEDAED